MELRGGEQSRVELSVRVCVWSKCYLFMSSSAKMESKGAEKMRKSTTKDQVQAFHLRKSLNLLDKMHEEKDVFIQKTK